MVVQETFGKNGKCSICKLSDIDVVNYGEIHSAKELTVHLFCLYFSTNLPQKGSDSAGIVGFEMYDLRKLISNCDKVKCCYCGKGSATTSCHHPNCQRTFHQVCGFKANARFEYLEEFLSFCDEHNEIENEDLEYPEINGCFLCFEGLGSYNPVTTVPSCCGFWFHQQCLRKYAVNAGYSFKCPTCRNENYAVFARRHGIFVPEYEALWEKTNDYADIERFYTHCDAIECICPKGRTFANHKWNLQLCSCCGSYGYHKLCRPVHERKDIIVCDSCKTTVTRWETEDRVHTHSLLAELNLQQENEVIDLTEDDDDILDQRIEEVEEPERIVSDARMDTDEIGGDDGANNADATVDLTCDNIVEPNIDANRNGREETLAEKRAREKAYRPIRDEMRNYRIGLWFRDYERMPQEHIDYECTPPDHVSVLNA